jgi:hypothetical protein
MNPKFTATSFVIKRKGLSADIFCICSPKEDLLFYVIDVAALQAMMEAD